MSESGIFSKRRKRLHVSNGLTLEAVRAVDTLQGVIKSDNLADSVICSADRAKHAALTIRKVSVLVNRKRLQNLCCLLFCLFCLIVTINSQGQFPAEPCATPSGSKAGQIGKPAIGSQRVKKFNDNVHYFIFASIFGFFAGLCYYTRKTK